MGGAPQVASESQRTPAGPGLLDGRLLSGWTRQEGLPAPPRLPPRPPPPDASPFPAITSPASTLFFLFFTAAPPPSPLAAAPRPTGPVRPPLGLFPPSTDAHVRPSPASPPFTLRTARTPPPRFPTLARRFAFSGIGFLPHGSASATARCAGAASSMAGVVGAIAGGGGVRCKKSLALILWSMKKSMRSSSTDSHTCHGAQIRPSGRCSGEGRRGHAVHDPVRAALAARIEVAHVCSPSQLANSLDGRKQAPVGSGKHLMVGDGKRLEGLEERIDVLLRDRRGLPRDDPQCVADLTPAFWACRYHEEPVPRTQWLERA